MTTMNSSPVVYAGRKKPIGDRAIKLLLFLADRQAAGKWPASIRDMSVEAGLSGAKPTSTSVVNYYLDKLEHDHLITRERKISRGVQVTDKGMAFAGRTQPVAEELPVVCPHCEHEFLPSVADRVQSLKATDLRSKQKRQPMSVAG
jgi:DNA-binding PadR family transcriptional regulator